MSPEQIKQIRTSLGMTQEAFAHYIGVSYPSINRWENGAYKPSRMAIDKIKSLIKEQKKVI
jgi:putative transcriptional regulator